jgi:hypothetical protein
LRAWIIFISHKLGIAEYMLPAPVAAVVNPAVEPAAANLDAAEPVANAIPAVQPIINPAIPIPQPVNIAPYKPPLFGLRVPPSDCYCLIFFDNIRYF